MLIALLATIFASLSAQRRVTPNTGAATTTQSINQLRDIVNPTDSTARRPASVIHAHDSQGNTVYVDTITGLEWRDTAAVNHSRVPRMTQPLMYSVAIGVDIWDPVMRIFGQKYGLVGFSGELNMHNRYIAVFEAGLGECKVTPDNANYTYHSSFAPYFRLGANYNFLYNSNPQYMVYAGVRYGWTSFNYNLTDVTLQNGYWDTYERFDIPKQTATVGYAEILFGLRVTIAANISLGWAFKYHTVLHGAKGHTYGDPWYIPGYGTRSSSVTGSFSITYTLPLKHKNEEKADT